MSLFLRNHGFPLVSQRFRIGSNDLSHVRRTRGQGTRAGCRRGNCRNATFYKVFQAFEINCQELQTVGFQRPRGGGRSAANALKVMVSHWFYNVSATVPMTLPMGEGPAGRQPGPDADGRNCRNAMFYRVYKYFRLIVRNCRR